MHHAYEWCAGSRNWFRSYGNWKGERAADGLMQTRFASINDLPIAEPDRLFHGPQGRRPDDHPGLSDPGLWADLRIAGIQFRAAFQTLAQGRAFIGRELRHQIGVNCRATP